MDGRTSRLAGYRVNESFAGARHFPQTMQHLDILLALKGRGFLLQDGDVPPRGYCELH